MRFNARVTPWRIDDDEFYEIERRDEQLAFAIRYATLAPSVRNTQPWAFRITPDGVDVYADYTRGLAALDRNHRELFLSVGAAIANLRIAAAHFGFATTVAYGADAAARVAFRETSDPDPHLTHLFAAIKTRRTNRRLFDGEPLDTEDLTTLFDFMAAFPDSLRIVLPCDLPRAAELVEVAERLQFADDAARNDIDEWLRDGEDGAVDGICADGFAMSRMARRFATPRTRARHDRELIESASALIVVAGKDEPQPLLETGEILERLLLTITMLGLQYSIVTSPIEVDELRDRVATLAAAPSPPQVMVRVGRAKRVTRAMPRRRLEAVLI